MSEPKREIQIVNACEHNLKSLSLSIPRDQLVVFTGVSGSGKSSLAFDTIFAEGQRKYMESLSAYARQFLNQMQKPNVERIDGLPPTIAIQQRGGGHTPRSTVATTTEIYDAMRLLWARCGTPTCWHRDGDEKICGREITAMSATQITDSILDAFAGKRVMLAATVIRARKGFHKDVLEALQKQGLVRARVDGKLIDIREALKAGGENPLAIGRYELHTIEAILDRIVPAQSDRQRLAESVETVLKLGAGSALALIEDGANWKEHRFSEKLACPEHPECSLAELEPRLFSFNNPMGACPSCDGLGHISFFDPKRVVAHPELSLASGAIKGWDRRNQFYFRLLQNLAKHAKFDLEAPFEELPKKAQELLLFGSNNQDIPFEYLNEKGKVVIREHAFEGIVANFERRYRETDSPTVREELAKYQNNKPCPSCEGTRLRTEARNVKVGDGKQARAIYEVSNLPLGQARDYFLSLELKGAKKEIAGKIISEIGARLSFLNDVGLNYLSLDRSADTLSGGEAQRIRLASQIGSGLTGVMYVLDEPSIGLHQRDNDRLIGTLKHLRDLGNSVLVVEHDEDMIRASDHVIDIGPGAGEHGGRIIAEGTPKEIESNPDSLTGAYLSGKEAIQVPKNRTPVGEHSLKILGATGNNLKNVDVEIPLGLLTCVTGVSGSGKSTLINDTLHHAVAQHLYGSNAEPAQHKEIIGLEHFDKVINVDQSPIGRTPRSNPATYTGLFTPIRELFAGVPAARERGYEAGRFSFNVKGGRCETCEGDGVLKVEMHFLPDVYVPCDVCHGKRYNRETLDIRYKGKNIHEVLSMTIEQAHEFFEAVPTVKRKLKTLLDVGLGYVKLGQSATTLSGGEAQRVKLSLELSKRDTGRTLYILDEPTTGLHFHDIQLLLKVIHTLKKHGNTIVIIEHNLDVIKTADWIIDLGPEGGGGGGEIIAVGTPEKVAKVAKSYTGKYLAPLLK